MIVSFRHRGLQRFWEKNNSKGIDSRYARAIRRRLEAMDEAETIEQLDVPGFGLHALKGNQAGRWAITVSHNWRLTFEFDASSVHIVDLEDYH